MTADLLKMVALELLLNSQIPPKVNHTMGFALVMLITRQAGPEQVEHVNALTPTFTYRIQAELTQSQAEGNKKAKFN